MTFRELIETDARWSRRLRLTRPGTAAFRLFSVIAHSADSWFWLIGLLVIWAFNLWGWRQRAAFLIIGLCGMAVFVLAVKFRVRRQRPEGEWGAIYRSTDPHSFPSGHAARAALFATLAIWLGPPWFAVLLAIWAPLVCLARVIMGVHYLSDVVAGALIGIVSGALLWAIHPVLLAWFGWLF